MLTVSLCFAAAVAIGLALAPLPQPFGYWFNPIILEFVFGMLIAAALREGLRLPPLVALSLIVAGIAMLAAFWVSGTVPRVIGFGIPAAAVVGGFVFLPEPRSQGIHWRVLRSLGDASYALYLLHPFALAVPRRLFPALIDAARLPSLYAAVLVALSLILAVSVHLLIEKPLTKALQRRIAIKERGDNPLLAAELR